MSSRYDDALAAIENDDAPGLIELLEAEPKLAKARGPDGDTLLHWACHHKQTELVEVLLSTGADVNAKGHFGRTPLQYAVTDCEADEARPVVEVLLAAGADPRLENDGGFDALAWARQELWEPDDALFALLGASSNVRRLRAVGGPEEQVRFIEARSHTELAAFGLLEAWGQGQAGATDASQLPSADAAALEALAETLKSLEASAWEPLFRAMARRLTPADLRATVEQVLRGKA